MSTQFFGDTAVLQGRSMRHIFRSVDTIITTAITPIAIMLLFVYVFGGAIETGTDNYVNYLLPGIMLIAIASGIAYTAVRLFTDMQSGIFERFHSMPIARSSVLWAHVLTSLFANVLSVVIIVLVGLVMGFRTSAGPLAWLAVAGILALFTLALTWIAVIAGLSAKSVDGAAGFSYPLIFLPFISSAFVPTDTMPGPVRFFAENQPVTSIVNAIQALFAQVPSAATSGSLSPGASASSSSLTSSRWPSTGARSPRAYRTSSLPPLPVRRRGAGLSRVTMTRQSETRGESSCLHSPRQGLSLPPCKSPVLSVRVTASDRTDTVVLVEPINKASRTDVKVADRTKVEFAGDHLSVKTTVSGDKNGSVAITIDLPAGSSFVAYLAHSDVHADGSLGECELHMAKGRAQLDRINALQANIAAGEVAIGHIAERADIEGSVAAVRISEVNGAVKLSSSGGQTWIGHASADLELGSANGGFDIDRADGSVTAKTANGAIRIGRLTRGPAELSNSSGNIEVGISEGTTARVDANSTRGLVRNFVPSQQNPGTSDNQVTVHARTRHGDILIRRAAS